jgi:membrane protein DedA with SNARE-associated domain
MVERVAEFCTYIIGELGYLGVGFLMALESMIAPIPSELVMPFAGFLAAEDKMSVAGIILATSLGSIIGSLISYYMGYFGGRPVVLKVGRYLLLNREHLDWTEQWFARHGSWTILVSRFIPVVRHLISIPAGMGRMRLASFCIYTLIGATIWNTFLLVCGFKLRQNWTLVQKYSHELDLIVVALLIVVTIWFVMTHVRRSRAATANCSVAQVDGPQARVK